MALLFSDNTTVVEVVNQQTTKDPGLMELVRELVVLCMSHNICFRAKQIPDKTTVVADLISRLYEDKVPLVQATLTKVNIPLPNHWMP